MTSQAKKPAISDEQLLQRHVEGDSGAIGALIRRYEKPLYGFLVRFTRNRALADDVFQETFLQVHLKAGDFDTSRSFKPWLYTIAANKARDALRKQRRHPAVPLDANVGGKEEAGTYVDLMPADVPPPETKLLNRELSSTVQTIVDEMPDRLREVLILGYFSELPYQTISEVLDIPLGTVKSRLHAAVRDFADRWTHTAEAQADE